MSATRPATEFSIGIIAYLHVAGFDRGQRILERRARHRLVVGVGFVARQMRIGAGLRPGKRCVRACAARLTWRSGAPLGKRVVGAMGVS